MLAAQSYLPPPPALVPYHFTAFNWDDRGEAHPVRPAATAVEPRGFLWLTQSDTEALALAQVAARLDTDFPPLRVHNISHLQTDADVDAFLNQHLPQAEVVVLRLLGGRSSFGHGFDHVVAHAAEHDAWLLCLPGTETLDPELTAHSNAGVPVTHEVLAYLQLGGLKNYEHALRLLADHLLTTGFGYDAPAPQPRHGVYHPDVPEGTLAAWSQRADPARPTVGVLFYRSHLLSGNTAFVDALVRAGEAAGANVLPVYAYSLKEYDEAPEPAEASNEPPPLQPLRLTDIEREQLRVMLGEFADDVLGDESEAHEDGDLEQTPVDAPPPPLPAALTYFDPVSGWPAEVLVCTMSFAMGGADASVADGDWSVEVLQRLDVPVLQAITASMGREQWQASSRGLTPLDTAMNVAIPEFDGRIITVPISFKQETPLPGVAIGTPVVHYAPDEERVRRVIGQALRLVALRRTPTEKRRVAFVLTNYSAKASRIANAVGLDSPASLLHLLQSMQATGYRISELPPDGDALMQYLIDRGCYDLDELTEAQMAGATASVPTATYAAWFSDLPAANQAEMTAKWGQPPGEHYVDSARGLFLAGVEYGNAFVAIQPPRGYGMDPTAIYHMPDLAPPHPYHALYRWLALPQAEGGWGAHAVVHLGKHGTLEWLPGKGIGVSAECYPDLFLGDLPLVYPFIINNPGEGAQAKRRTHAVVIDHMTPPMTTAEGYGELEELQRLVDEYYQMEQLDPTKLPLLQQQIWALIRKARLDSDLARMLNFDSEAHTHEWDPEFHEDGVPYTISDLTGRDFAHLVENINGYLCELTSAQIRDGLHVLGQSPEGDQLVDTLLALVRLPNLQVPSLRAGIAACFGLNLDAVLDDLGARCEAPAALASVAQRPLPTNAEILRAIDDIAEYAMLMLAAADFRPEALPSIQPAIFWPWTPNPAGAAAIDRTLDFVCRQLAPNLRRIDDEITNLLHALEGGFIPPGPSGAPTRGMAHVLPTGRNFYAVDPR
ncbi:MAG: cobaltochelatase subunit CobN, partial [Aquabacterium sp.]